MKKILLMLAFVQWAFGAEEQDLSRLSSQLENEDFEARQAAVSDLAAAGDEEPERVIRHLCGEDANLGPEARARIPDVLKLMFQRHNLGVGEPQTGMTFKLYIEVSPKDGISRVHPIIEDITSGSLAEAAGFRKGDVIVSLNGTEFEGDDSVIRLKQRLRKEGAGAKLKVDVRRYEIKKRPMLAGKGETKSIEITLGEPSPPIPEKINPEDFAGWLLRMRMHHGLPERFAQPQS